MAKQKTYGDEVLDALQIMEAAGSAPEEIVLSEAYLKAGGAIAETRHVQARYWLGTVLKQIAAE